MIVSSIEKLLIIFFCGILLDGEVVYRGLFRIKLFEITWLKSKRKSKILMFSIIFFVLFLLFFRTANAEQVSQEKGYNIDKKEVFITILPVFATFIFLVSLGYISNLKLDKGEIRRAIAGTFVIAFVVLLFILILLRHERTNEIISAFIAMATTIVGFYFGSRTVQQVSREEEVIEIENVEFRNGKLLLSLRNRGEKIAEIDAIYINNKHIEVPKLKIPPRSLLNLPLSFKWYPEKECIIEVCTSTGICSQIKVKAPGGKEE